jgi:O-methyltransferase
MFAFVHLDADLYDPIMAGLQFFYPRVAKGGIIVVHDYNSWPGARRAVDVYFQDKPEVPVPMPDKSGSVVIVRTSEAIP